MGRLCKKCGRGCYGELCVMCKPRKPINKKGKQAIKYEQWRDTVAKPYLDREYGHICAVPECKVTELLDVDHIEERGSRPDLKYSTHNVRYLCRAHHRLVTDGKLKI